MATSPVPVVATTSTDISGISTVTSTPTLADDRAGSIYDSVTLAGAQPIWFHPLPDGQHLMLSQRTWSAATPVGGSPGIYSAHTESQVPSWWIVNGASGKLTIPPNQPNLRTPVTSALITDASSRPSDLMWVLYSVVIGGEAQALMQMWTIDRSNSLMLSGEEVLPKLYYDTVNSQWTDVEITGADVLVFDKGIQYTSTMLYIYGTDSDGVLYRIRKLWNRIGFNRVRPTIQTLSGGTWECYHGSGWSTDFTETDPIQEGLTSDGPVSFGSFRTQQFMSTVTSDGTQRTGVIWTSNSGRPWVKAQADIPLGDTSDGSYLGGVELQSQLGANQDTLATGVNAGIPYNTTRKVTSTGSSLVVSWSNIPVTLIG
jgi:hypothetical protein